MARFLPTLALAATALASGAGCPDGGTEATATIGTGTTEFEPLSAEQNLGIVAGPQGGHHFIVHAQMSGIAPGDVAMPGLLTNPATQFSVFAEGGARVDEMFPPYRLGYRDVGEGTFELPSGRILVVQEGLVESLYDQRVRIRVEIAEENGPAASDEVFVVVREDLNPPDADAGPVDAPP